MTINIDALDPSGDIRTVAEEAGAYDPTSSRREMLTRAGIGGAGILGAGAALGMLSPVEAWAASATGAYSTRHKSAANDLKIGNYALTLEYLEAAFYAQAVANGRITDPDIGQFAQVVAGHEATHVAELKHVLGRKAVSAPKVDFGGNVLQQSAFITTAAALEPVGTAAYAGAAPHIKTPAILKAALSIHSVEANHAAWAITLLRLKGYNPHAVPAPNANNPAYGYKKVLGIVGKTGFVKGNLHP